MLSVKLPLGRDTYERMGPWIGPDGVEAGIPCMFRVRKRIDRLCLDPAGRISIAAESYYALYINGQHVGNGPARGTETCHFVDTLDVSNWLQEGLNTVAVEVYCDNLPTFKAAPTVPAVLIESGATVCDASWQIQIAGELRTHDIGLYTRQVGFIEWRDQRRRPHGWTRFADGSKWESPEVFAEDHAIYHKSLFHRDVAFLRSTLLNPVAVAATARIRDAAKLNDPDIAAEIDAASLEPLDLDLSPLLNGHAVTIFPIEQGGVSIVLDFGCEFIGHLDVDIEAPAGCFMDIGYQECVEGNRLALALGDYRFADRYICAEGRQVIDSPLRWRGGRFVQCVLRQFDRPVTLRRVGIRDERYPLNRVASFETDDKMLTGFWPKAIETISACAIDTLIDCPWREMAMWVNDLIVANRYWLQLAGRADLSRRCIALALSQREPGGLIPGVCPYDGDGRLVLFPTNLFLPMMIADYALYTGDLIFVRKVIGPMFELLERCDTLRSAEKLLIPPEGAWNFIDWSFEMNDRSLDGRCACAVNWFGVLAWQNAAELCRWLGEPKEFECRERADGLASQVDSTFWDSDIQAYREWLDDDGDASPPAGLLSHALALLAMGTNISRGEKIEAALMRDDLLSPDLYMLHFVLDALCRKASHGEAIERIKKFWGEIVASDSPTIWEANVHGQGKDAFEGRASLCHAFSLAPVHILQSYMLGVRPIEPGFSLFRFDPHLMGQTRIQGTVPTPGGWLQVSAEAEPDGIRVKLKVPPSTQAVLNNGQKLCAGDHAFMM